ncbi:CPBP family glutamic-type intramembrane protease [Nocardioides bruguierae]|uniref:CPBP family glutamic-type intramembrane protease n=1 Tax=Nocardioides bruguierae TaxID=2945102 RepID=UPI0020214E5E|nr:CPBP family intramembrane glutamic endopeptidase [Nocardioides bruguierae]MCL8024089.1 CPBP family intramembrane metalloprotease [Nocardioides bruguierae]
MSQIVRRSLWDKVPRDHWDSPQVLRRRQVVVAVVVVAGAVALGFLLRTDPGSVAFYLLTLVLAAIWTTGAFVSGRIHLGRIAFRDRLVRPVLSPFLVGAVMVGVFVAGGYLVQAIDVLAPLVEEIRSVLDYSTQGSLPILVVVTAINGIAEELFFRGAAYAATPRRPVLVTTVAYLVATLASGNVMLAFAAVLLGVVVGLERRASGGVLAPIITHLTWSLSMLLVLPLVFA